MEWQATDQFGNLYIGESDATSVEALRPAVESLVTEVAQRSGDGFRVTADFAYGELNAPDPESVSHLLRVPWFASAPREETAAALGALVAEVLRAHGLTEARFEVA